jgi:N-acetylglucosaminyl-diphospho-decaprenol L-rhamnosyltransferase
VSPNGLGVVVLAYGSGGEYLAVVESLAAQGVAADQVLVVHNPSEPGERLPEPPPGWEVLNATHNLGYAAGMNLGIARLLEGEAELALLLTHDASLRPGALERLLAAARAEPAYGVLGPALFFADTEEAFSFGGRTSAGGSLSHLKARPPGKPVAPCDWVDGGTMLIRTEALAGARGFDERLWGYCEDADLCLRISRAGFGVGVVPEAVADQVPGGAKRPGPWAYLLTRNGLAYARRARGARGVAATTLRAAGLVVSELARTLARLTRLRPGDPAATWPVAVGTARGVLDFARAHWGPPPSLPGGGDLKNVDGPETPPYVPFQAHQRDRGPDG